MREKPTLSEQLIVKCLSHDYGIDVKHLIFLPLGADINASVYRAEAKDELYFVKLKRGHHPDIASQLVECLHEAGIEGIIPPIKTIHGRLTHRVEDFTLIVYPFVEGQDGFHRRLTDHQWVKLGQALRQVHEMNVPPSIQNKIRRETYSSQWRDTVCSLVEAEPVNDKLALKLDKFMKENVLIIRRLIDGAEQLSQQLQNPSQEFVLCHSDIHAGNVLLAGSEIIYIVDWDEPIMAPKERDLMFIGGGVGNVWNIPDEEKFFYEGYGKTKVNKTLLAYYRHERIIEDIAVYGQKLLLSQDGGEDRSQMFKQFLDMFKPRGVVDIALESDVKQR